MNRVKFISFIVVSISMISCATSSKEIAASYVSPAQYRSFNCEQLSQELERLNRRKTASAADLDKKASNDEGLTAVSAILFWPAAFALGGNQAQEAEYARLKGEYDAVQQAGVEKNCKLNTSKSIQAAQITSNATSISEGSVVNYYGQAEEEVDKGTYNKNLWAKALVDVEGDEAKRKAKYIELRARQLYSEKVGSISNSNQYEQPAIGDNVTGSYMSTITGNIQALNIKGRNPEVKLTQKGKNISGTFGSKGGMIWGEIEDGNIKFKYQSSAGNTGTGEWTVKPDSKEIIGKWSSSWIGEGKWDLVRIQ